MHNLIYLAEDVEYTGVQLRAISAFIFESCLGAIKDLIRRHTKPLYQLVRRIAELHSCPEASDLLEVNYLLSKRVYAKTNFKMELHKRLIDFSRDNVKTVIFRDMIIDTTEANNTVQLKSG